jgi:hypothetical protein
MTLLNRSKNNIHDIRTIPYNPSRPNPDNNKREEKKRKEKTCVRETHVGQDEKSKIKRTLWLPTPQTVP